LSNGSRLGRDDSNSNFLGNNFLSRPIKENPANQKWFAGFFLFAKLLDRGRMELMMMLMLLMTGHGL
jgi:hypothetical protein